MQIHYCSTSLTTLWCSTGELSGIEVSIFNDGLDDVGNGTARAWAGGATTPNLHWKREVDHAIPFTPLSLPENHAVNDVSTISSESGMPWARDEE